MIIRKTAVALAAILLFCGLAGCGVTPQPETRTVFAMDTVVTMTAYGKNADSALDEAARKLNEYDILLDVDSGDIGSINAHSGEFVEVEAETYTLLSECVELSRRTDGAFDITIGRYVDLWGFRAQTRVPSDDELSAAGDFIGWDKIEFSDGKVKIPEGARIDLGAVAKGWAAGKIKAVLVESGIESAILSLGGNVTTLGKKPDGSLFNIAVRDPNDPDAYIDTVQVSDLAVVTSGGYMRYFELDGVRYHHILDPKTGRPSDSGLISVTVICSDDTAADAYSTAFFVMGFDRASEFLTMHPEISAILITLDGQIYHIN